MSPTESYVSTRTLVCHRNFHMLSMLLDGKAICMLLLHMFNHRFRLKL